MIEVDEVYVYPVGFLKEVIHLTGYWIHSPYSIKQKIKHTRSTARWVRKSCTRRSYWNGYLAEPTPWPDNGLRTCGHGWTKARALRKLNYYSATQADGTVYPSKQTKKNPEE